MIQGQTVERWLASITSVNIQTLNKGFKTMKSITRHTGTLKKITRMKNSRDGNPQFMLYCDGYKFRTPANASIGYNIDSYFDKEVTVTIGLYRNCLTLNTIHLN
jgi:hypothetical protein